MSLAKFGAECGLFAVGVTTLTTGLITIRPNSMILNNTYGFLVTTSAADGRSDIQSVRVSPVFKGSAVISITSSFLKFNPGMVTSKDMYIKLWRYMCMHM